LEKIFNSQNSTKVEEKSPDFFFYIYLAFNQIWLNLPVGDGSFSLCCLHITNKMGQSAFGEDFQ
jgi:hypothetical protein